MSIESSTSPASSAQSATSSGPASPPAPAVLLFQRAHQKIAMLARLDEQVMQLLARRRQLQEELRAVQTEINDEFERLIRLVDEPPPALRGYASDRTTGSAASKAPIVERSVDPRRGTQQQFAVQPITSEAAVA